MQNDVPEGTGPGGREPLTRPEDSLSYTTPQPTVTYDRPSQTEASSYAAEQRKTRFRSRLGVMVFSLLALLVIGGSIFVFIRRDNGFNQIQIGAFGDVRIPLAGILNPDGITNDAQRLKVNGQLDVSKSVVLTPTSRPDNPVIGQLYFDQATNRLTYYDGQQFLELQAGTAGTTQITNNSVTNIFGGNTIGGGGIDLIGTTGSLAMFTGAGSLGDSRITQNGSTITIGSPASDNTIQLGTGGGTQTVGVGSPAGASTTTIQGGTGGAALSTGNATGVSGSISITTGNSSTTASGNITIDAGEGIVDGEIIEDKTFEGGTESMVTWFGSTVAQTSAQAHNGVYSLGMTTTDSFWGVQELLPGTAVIAGHQYYFSLWVRAATTPRTINVSVVWNGTGGQQVTFTPTVDSATGWTQMTATAPAPATATSASFRMSGSGATIGEQHYFDDITITDLSSSAAISAISIGATNAKVVTIGNMNQIGATAIYGSSGIALNSGAAGTTINGGVVNITGNAASSLSTTTGSLTLTSADSTTWGVGTAVSGVGGNLTLRAGRGGTDANNNGGDLILQGGAPNGTGIAGGVIVRPQTDSTDAFQVQNSATIPLFTVDSSAMDITISGTDTAYARFTLSNAHFASTQTTPPAISTPANCGTTPAAALTPGSTDSAGSFTITTGTGGTASSCDTTITFHQLYAAAPKSILVVGKADAVSAQRQPFVSNVAANNFSISFGTGAGGADNTAYQFSYWVIE